MVKTVIIFFYFAITFSFGIQVLTFIKTNLIEFFIPKITLCKFWMNFASVLEKMWKFSLCKLLYQQFREYTRKFRENYAWIREKHSLFHESFKFIRESFAKVSRKFSVYSRKLRVNLRKNKNKFSTKMSPIGFRTFVIPFKPRW